MTPPLDRLLKAPVRPGLSFAVAYRQAPNRRQATALVSWSPSRPARPHGDKPRTRWAKESPGVAPRASVTRWRNV